MNNMNDINNIIEMFSEMQIPELTEIDKKIIALNDELGECYGKLSSTDYKAIKYSEGWYSEEEYKPIKTERENLRIKIREIQSELEELRKELNV